MLHALPVVVFADATLNVELFADGSIVAAAEKD